MFKVEALSAIGIPLKKREVESAYQALCLYRGWYYNDNRSVAGVSISVAQLKRKSSIVPGSLADQVTPLQEAEKWKIVKRSEVSSYMFEKAHAELLEDWFGVPPEEPEPTSEPERPTPPPGGDERQLRLFDDYDQKEHLKR